MSEFQAHFLEPTSLFNIAYTVSFRRVAYELVVVQYPDLTFIMFYVIPWTVMDTDHADRWMGNNKNNKRIKGRVY
jgi:hypothetical protein